MPRHTPYVSTASNRPVSERAHVPQKNRGTKTVEKRKPRYMGSDCSNTLAQRVLYIA